MEIINKMIEEKQGNPDVLECLRILKLGIKAEISNCQPQHLMIRMGMTEDDSIKEL